MDHNARKIMKYADHEESATSESIKTLHELAVDGEELTRNHGKVVSEIAGLMCLELGTTDRFTKAVIAAAYFHDIGKNKVPSRIIHKPSQLSHQERELVKEHSMLGYFSAKHSLLVHPGSFSIHERNLIEMVTLTHHEYWDGTGYPLGLKEREIPLASRICTYGDVFDALTATRPYKNRSTIKEAMDYIESQVGIIFDPSLYEIFKVVIAAKYKGLKVTSSG